MTKFKTRTIASVVGARPQFVKAATVSRALAGRTDLAELIIHTGQHFDSNMSGVFFEELDIPKPTLNLGVRGGAHGLATGQMMIELETAFESIAPDCVLVFGDTNTTLAAAVTAAKMHIPVAHVEAGLRSYNKRMPEEINRILTDHVSDLLLCPTPKAVESLQREGVTKGVHLVGDVMYDAVLHYKESIKPAQRAEPYILSTLHRAENVDDRGRLSEIVDGFRALDTTVVLPLHPRTKSRLEEFHIQLPNNVLPIDPVPYLEMLRLVLGSELVITDSGGLQKEAYFLGKPCVTTRDETEWVELVEGGVNELVGADAARLSSAVEKMLKKQLGVVSGYGSGHAAAAIVELLVAQML